MGRKLPVLYGVAIAIILGLFGYFAPFVPLKILTSLIAVVFLGLSFRRMSGVFIALSILFVVIPLSALVFFNEMPPSLEEFDVFFGEFSGHSSVIEPDTSIENAKHILIRTGAGVIAEFVPDSSVIELPSDIKVKRTMDRVELYGAGKKVSYKFRIGLSGVEEIYVDSVGASVSGRGNLKHLKVSATGIKASGNCQIDVLELDGTGITVSGEFSGKNLNIEGTGLNVCSTLGYVNVNIDGTGMNLDLKLHGTERLRIDGTSISGKIEYTDEWTESRYVDVDGTAGVVKIKAPANSPLIVNSSGVKIFRE